MNAKQFFTAVSTALLLTATGAHAKDGQPENIQAPADAKIDFAVRFPQGTIMRFAYDPKLGDHPLNRNHLFFCPNDGKALPKLCFQQVETTMGSTSNLYRYFNYSSKLGQIGADGKTAPTGELDFDFEKNKFSLGCRTAPGEDAAKNGAAQGQKSDAGQPYSDAEKAQLQQAVRDGDTKLLSLPDYDEVLGVFKTPDDDTIIVTWPKYNFSVDGIGYYRGDRDMVRYKVTGYGESAGYTLTVPGQGTLNIPFNLRGEHTPATLVTENGIGITLRRLDPEAPQPWVKDQFGTPKHPKDAQPFETPCNPGIGLNF